MNLTDHPELADRLAAAYGLGTLRGGARRRFEAQARSSPALRAAALAWQERFAAMTELQPGEAPSPNVWKRIEIELANQPRTAAAKAEPLARKALRWWRGAAFAGGLATAAAVGVVVYLAGEVDQRGSQLAQVDRNRENLARENVQLAAQLQAQPAIQYVAVLSDDRAAPSLLVTFDPVHNTLTLKRVGAFQEGPEKSLQLWALPPSGSPRSLGVLGAEPVIKLTAAESQVRQVPALAVSLEPKGGVPSERGPTGPVLFKGALLQTP
ncbi:MAG TPA: anti-sigma factor [Burkholderiales bacterium]|nr:anti-sigma factor [Burkholderiales bacterium]